MQNIIISSFLSEAASKSSGIKLLEKLEPLVQSGNNITVDFGGISRFASPFFNNSFAKLTLLYGFEILDRIELLQLSETGRDAFDSSIDNARLLSENPDYSEQINNIIYINTPKKDD